MRFAALFALTLLLAPPAGAADQPQVERGSTSTHSSACDLGESMAGKLGLKGTVSTDGAQRTCGMLAPTMNDTDRVDFVRCCVARLIHTEGQPANTPRSKAEKKSL
jgi:hypothetical protein